MKVFVSGQIQEKKRIREVFRVLESRGCSITHDWTRTDNIDDKLRARAECGLRAEKDIDGVVDCDVYLLMSDNSSVGKGMYVELGAALALRSVQRKPEIYVVGPMNHLSIFYLHPEVTAVDTVEDVVKSLEGKSLLPKSLENDQVYA